MLLKFVVADSRNGSANEDRWSNWTPCPHLEVNVPGVAVIHADFESVEWGGPLLTDPALIGLAEADGVELLQPQRRNTVINEIVKEVTRFDEGSASNVTHLYGRGGYEPFWAEAPQKVWWVKGTRSPGEDGAYHATYFLHTGWAFICDDAGKTLERNGPKAY